LSEQNYRARAPFYIEAEGKRITLADLPPRDTKRWFARQKALVVAAVQHGLLSFEEARERYNLSIDEYLSWHRSVGRHNLSALRATQIRD
jgi:hypothetical protein